MKILLIPYNYPTSENHQRAIFIADQVNMLREQGHDVSVLGVIPKTLNDIFNSRNLKFGRLSSENWLISLPAIRGMGFLNNIIQLFIGKWIFKRYLSRNSIPDVVHVHNSSSAELALWVKKKYKIPFVVTEHSSLMWSGYNKLSRLVFKESKANIAVSKRFAQHLSKQYNEKFYYIPNVVDTSYFQPIKFSEEIYSSNFNVDDAIFVSVGNLTENKNHRLAIKAFKNLVIRFKDIKLFIAGEGPERQSLEKLISELGLCNNVFLLGKLPRNEVRELLWKSDFFVLPSKSETFGVVLIEAMAAGLPILSLQNGGSESIVNSSVGFIAKDDREFTDNMAKLLVTPFNKEEIIEYARLNFSQSVVSHLLKKVYTL
ncbi:MULTISPECIES: glycosyltransferase [unclassified Pseudoalteromonas]|uniref:glycosyltransferase n=1 Tax=unclassified Pseudoalteromonas TaxID=194690 RepID=UPI0025B30A31|nr:MULTISPECIES: glycosyltransferase [unclassified Pseudoalteromonas]MDN3408128.1 glycosyltransferase [Pseudoalteromonas sp. APC 3894]MDN3415768.1 glycosyltransferase [Pseudoalteromonas sp. APC 3227]MDN3419466.1 glycosyltransferase [Pseudoalteromonas sp. APC 3895]MDN3422835.1 glycosyltransferase [Pseudoalteromonas sp. APC 3896]